MAPYFSKNQIINQLDGGAEWAIGRYSGAPTANIVTYGAPTNKSWLSSSASEYAGWSRLNASQIKAVNTAIELWDDVIKTNIVKAGNPNNADIRVSNTTTGIEFAHAYFPGATGRDGNLTEKLQGSVWLNPEYNSGTNDLTNPTIGRYSFTTIIHELGHALGLSHPGDYGLYPTYASDAEYKQDTQMYTVMSYFEARHTGAKWTTKGGAEKYPQTPMVHDILAIQSIYGVDTTTRTGNNTYGFHSNLNSDIFNFSRNNSPILTIWDAGGNDTLDFSGWSASSTINLTPGTYSSANSMKYNIAIAFGVKIENAVSGSGSDTIIGNGLSNFINANKGNDKITAGGGNDTILGGYGNDRIDGGPGIDLVDYSGFGGKITVNLNNIAVQTSGGGGRDKIYNVENAKGGDHADTLTGKSGVSKLWGGDGNDELAGSKGNDQLYGQNGNDYLRGGDDNDQLIGGRGLDKLVGGSGNDVMKGGADNDLLIGGDGNDKLYGGADRDILIGDNSSLAGGGEDRFMFSKLTDFGTGADRDIIRDFEQGSDKIQLRHVDAITGGSDDAFVFIGTAGFSGTAGELRYGFGGGDTVIAGDVDGDGTADLEIQLTGNIALTVDDFVL